jgi:hypothetical protein
MFLGTAGNGISVSSSSHLICLCPRDYLHSFNIILGSEGLLHDSMLLKLYVAGSWPVVETATCFDTFWQLMDIAF